jgi:hypothetical protein
MGRALKIHLVSPDERSGGGYPRSAPIGRRLRSGSGRCACRRARLLEFGYVKLPGSCVHAGHADVDRGAGPGIAMMFGRQRPGVAVPRRFRRRCIPACRRHGNFQPGSPPKNAPAAPGQATGSRHACRVCHRGWLGLGTRHRGRRGQQVDLSVAAAGFRSRGGADAGKEGQDFADGAFPAGGFWQREVRLDLVAVAAAVLLLDHVAGIGPGR